MLNSHNSPAQPVRRQDLYHRPLAIWRSFVHSADLHASGPGSGCKRKPMRARVTARCESPLQNMNWQNLHRKYPRERGFFVYVAYEIALHTDHIKCPYMRSFGQDHRTATERGDLCTSHSVCVRLPESPGPIRVIICLCSCASSGKFHVIKRQ